MAAGSRITVDISGSSSELQAAVARASDSLKSLGDVLAKQTDTALRMSGKTIDANDMVARSFAATADAAGLASDKTIRAFERQGAVILDGAKVQQAALAETADAAKASSDVQVQASEKASLASRAAADTHAASAKKIESAFGSSGSGLTKFGKVLTLGLIGAAVASGDLAVKFQANTLRMETQAGATAAQLQKLRQGILDMAGSVGYTPNALADALYHVVSSMNALLPASQRVSGELKVMTAAAKLAQIGHSNLEETTYALVSAMNALHEPISQTSKVAGQLNAIVGAGDLTMQQLVNTLSTGVLPTARGAGVSLQSLGAAIAAMGDMGQQGAMVGTRLRMSIALLASPSEAAAKVLQTLGLSAKEAVSTSAAMAAALEKAGLRTTQLSADLHSPDGILTALHDLNQHLISAGLTSSGAAAVMNKAFGGGRMGATIVELAQNTDRLSIKFHQIGDSANQFGQDWQKQGQTTAQQLHNIEGGVISLGTRFGTDLLPYAEDAVHDFTAIVHWFEQGSTAAHDLEIAIGTLATVAIGSYLVSNLMKAIKLMRELGSFVNNPLGVSGAINRATAPTALGGGSPALGGVGGISGARGFEAPGSIQNPIVVAMEAGEYAGLSSMGAAGTVSNEMGVAKAETGAVESATGAAIPVAGGAAAAEEAGVLATLKGGFNTLLGGLLKGGLIAGGGIVASNLAGSVIKGQAGKDVSTIGKTASVGAALGSFLGPEGTLAGGIVGALAGGFETFVSQDATKYGRDIANSIGKEIGPAVSSATTKSLASDLNKAKDNAAVAKVAESIRPGSKAQALGPRIPAGTLAAESQAEYNQAGQAAASAFQQGFSAVSVKTEPQFIADAMSTLKKLPAQARDAAASEMVSYATSLEDNGKLPKGATDDFISKIERSYSGLTLYLQQQGEQNKTVIDHSMKFDGAVTNLVQTETQVRSKFGLWATDPTINGGNVIEAFQSEMSQLKTIAAGSTGKAHDAAMSEMTQLRSGMASTMSGMEQDTADRFGQMLQNVQAGEANITAAVIAGSQQAAQTGEANYTKFAVSVQTAMAAGVLATSQGMQLIAKAMNATIKALGGAAIPVPQLERGIQLFNTPGVGPSQLLSAGVNPGGAATGGWIGSPGEKGPDAVATMLGRGEAVLNHQQQAVVNTFVPGGLDAVFSMTAGSKHWMAAGGYAGGTNTTGGTLSYSQLEGLWDQANPTLTKYAPIMAAIAMAESSGRDVTNSIGAAGYWQIYGLPFPGNPLDPLTNAKMAGAKLESQGLGAWVTYQTGAYKQFLNGSVPASLGAFGSVGQITAPKVSGAGAIASIANAALGSAANAANQYLATLGGNTAGAGGAGAGGASTATGGGLVTPNAKWNPYGKPIASWIVPVLEWAASKGWSGHVTSGYRTPAEQMAAAQGYAARVGQSVSSLYAGGNPLNSNHLKTVFPGGAVDIDGGSDAQLIGLLHGYAGLQGLVGGSLGPGDPYHFSHTGFSGGGLVYAAGGRNPKFPTKTIKPPKTKPGSVKGAPKGIATGMTTKDMQELSGIGGQINSLETQIAALAGQYSADTTLFPPQEGALQYLNPDGSLNAAGYAKKIADDQTLLGLDQQLLGLYNAEVPVVTKALKTWLGAQSAENRAVVKDTNKENANKRTLANNKVKEASIRKAILDLSKPGPNEVQAIQDQITALKNTYAPQVQAAQRAKQTYTGTDKATKTRLAQVLDAIQNTEKDALDPLNNALLAAKVAQQQQAQKVKVEKFNLNQQLSTLTKQDATLGKADVGIGQEITSLKGWLSGANGTQSTNATVNLLETVAAKLGTVEWGSGGAFVGINTQMPGEIVSVTADIQSLTNDIGTATGDQTGTTTQDNSQLVGILQQSNLQLAEALSLNEAQTSVLAGMIPQIPHYATGGPVLDDGLIFAHRGEYVLPTHGAPVVRGGGPTTVELHQHYHGNAGALMDLIDQRIQHPSNVRSVSTQIGRRTSMLSNRPGARRTDRI